ncbi:MAG: isoaspartyl peptidase/L-asparaginase [Bacteroidetes bacterium]|nr:isoaspartyl peptidase/L-asparaginase [Bacteroidota bacterium]
MRAFLVFLFFFIGNLKPSAVAAQDRYVLVIHGGAGTILKSKITPEQEKRYQESLEQALLAGQAILQTGGKAIDAVEAAVRVLEDNPLFNAGKGAVFTNQGKNELDAAIMNGQNLSAGAVAGVSTIRNPISAARAVMEKSEHVMLSGIGAEQFAKEMGIEMVDPSYFYTPQRWHSLEIIRQRDSLESTKKNQQPVALMETLERKKEKYGTVGAVALDMHGNLAAATSTGGMTNKKWGRIGDAPIIGAGTYANNTTAAVSCTGWGEYFIRLVMAKSICDQMEYGGKTLEEAANQLVMQKLPALGGDGGLIAVDKDGNMVMPFCTEGMYRGYIRQDSLNGPIKKETALYKN